jgi:anti-sigma B factor antagonist
MNLVVTEVSATTAVVALPVDHLDAGNVKAFREAMQSVSSNYNTIVIDMGPLNFVDSSGLGALLSCLRAMGVKNGHLRLFGMTKPVKALFELVRMHRIFTICGSREEALAEPVAA